MTRRHKGTKPRLLEVITACPCGQRHDLWTRKGAVHLRTLDVSGKARFTPLEILKLESRRGARSHRWYHLLQLPCGQTHRVRLNSTTDDETSGFNRAKHLTQLPSHHPDRDRIYGWRADAESLNNGTDRRLWGGRMVAYGAERQTLFLIGYALAQNALATAINNERRLTSATAA